MIGASSNQANNATSSSKGISKPSTNKAPENKGNLLMNLDDIFSNNTQSNSVEVHNNVDNNQNKNQNAMDFDSIFSNNLFSTTSNNNVATDLTSNTKEVQNNPPKQDTMDIFSQISNIYQNDNNNKPVNNQLNNLMDLNFGGVSQTNQSNNNFNMNNNMNNNNNFMNNNLMGDNQQSTGFDFGQNSNNNNNSKNMKEIFKNSEITIYCTSSKDNNDTNATLHLSNNIDKQLTNVKINLFVIKYVSYKVISTSGTVLGPRQSFGIKKVIYFYNL